MLVRGIYFEEWDPTRVPLKMHRDEFLARIRNEFPYEVPGGIERLLDTVVQALRRHITEGRVGGRPGEPPEGSCGRPAMTPDPAAGAPRRAEATDDPAPAAHYARGTSGSGHPAQPGSRVVLRKGANSHHARGSQSPLTNASTVAP